MTNTPAGRIEQYRAHVIARGDKPKAVWALVRDGFIIDWYLSKHRAEQAAERQYDCVVVKAA